MNALSLHHVHKIFRDHQEHLVALRDITLDIHEGEFFVFVGPSGCGKSTLLRIMSGLEKSFEGTVHLENNITSADMSFVFQQFALLPWLTVEQNIALGLTARHVPREEQKTILQKELQQFGLEKFAHVYTKALSGGMRQRVGIARALASNPKIIFMDEPFSELDSFTANKLRKELLTIWQVRRPTIVMVTHIIEEALELADRVAVLTPRPGSIETIVENTLSRPRNHRTDEFFAMEDKIYKIIKP